VNINGVGGWNYKEQEVWNGRVSRRIPSVKSWGERSIDLNAGVD